MKPVETASCSTEVAAANDAAFAMLDRIAMAGAQVPPPE
jgi:hypothetical protein